MDLCREIVDAEVGSDEHEAEAEVESVVRQVEHLLGAARLVLDGRDEAAREQLTKLLADWEAARR